MSAADASMMWNLRCEVREEMIRYLRENYPNVLVKTRVRLDKRPDIKRQDAGKSPYDL
jgi:hypothetical protein